MIKDYDSRVLATARAVGLDAYRTNDGSEADRVLAAMEAFHDALLTTEAEREPQDSLEEAAHLLATESQHPRYTAVGGWERLLESTVDVEVAYNSALKVRGVEVQLGPELARARHMLITHLQTAQAPR